MLIKQPHAFGGIHGGSAAEGNDDIGLEAVHCSNTAHNGLHRGIRLNFREYFRMAVLCPLAEIIEYFIHIPQLHHHRIGDNERSGDIGHLFEILDRIILKVNLGWNFKPLHIYSPLGNAFFVDQINRGYIGGGRVPSERATAQGQRRGIGVINVADGALGRGRVGDNTSHLHLFTVAFAQRGIIGVDDSGMAQTTKFQHLLGHRKTLFAVFDHKICQHWRKLFPGKGIIRPHILQSGQQDLGFLRDLHSGLFRNPPGGFSNHHGIHGAFLRINHKITYFLGLFWIKKVAIVIGHDLLKLRSDLFIYNSRLLRSTDHSIIKCFG